jgi:sugar lactone lactonase YvrE
MTTAPDPPRRVVREGLAFPEGPRWHEGRLWLSDMHAHRVLALGPGGTEETVVRVPGRPSGLGWLPDGRLLVVSMEDRRLLRLEEGRLVEHADLSGLASFHCNDMVVDARGRAFVGNFGFDLHDPDATPKPAELIRVDPDGRAEVVARDLRFPNGCVITPDGRTLVVGESFAARLTAFDLDEDGGLSGRRTWARLEGAVPDGICLDAEGALWVASPVSNEVLRVREGGEVLDRVPTDQLAIACMLGDEDRRTLYVLTAPTTRPDEAARLRGARVEALRVGVPGAGLP